MLKRGYEDAISSNSINQSRFTDFKTSEELRCSLPVQVQDLMKTICPVGLKDCMSSSVPEGMLPLGKLSHSVIMEGMDILRQIEAEISGEALSASLADLSSQFYTFIPHAFGKSAPPLLCDRDYVASKVELLLQLLNVTVAVKNYDVPERREPHPLDVVYSKLHCSIQPLDPGPELDMVKTFIVRVPFSSMKNHIIPLTGNYSW
jgi:poly [ADP-ribose] polymerase